MNSTQEHEEISQEDDHRLNDGNMTSAVNYFLSPRGTHYYSTRPTPDMCGGHPPMDVSFPAQTMGPPSNFYQPPPHPSDSYYPHAVQHITPQYGLCGATSAPQTGAPPHHDQQYHNHPAAHPDRQFFYGSWAGANDSPMQNNFYYNPAPYQTILPPDAAQSRDSFNGGGRTSKKSKDYRRQPLNLYDVENEHLRGPIAFVRRNPNATLFDIDGKWTLVQAFLVPVISEVSGALIGFTFNLMLSLWLRGVFFSLGLISEVACVDERAAQFIQKRLREGTVEEANLGMTAALANLDVLWRDHYGSFMLQGLFEFGSNEMKTQLMDAIYKLDVVQLCMHRDG